MNAVMKVADVRWVYRHFPLPSHPFAAKAAEAAECAGDQGKFWEYSDMLFSLEGKITDEALTTSAQKIGLDWVAFGLCVNSGKHRAAVASQRESGMHLKISGTPTFYLNGKRFEGNVPMEDLKKLLGTPVR
jgi:protein-disulfide isomerase